MNGVGGGWYSGGEGEGERSLPVSVGIGGLLNSALGNPSQPSHSLDPMELYLFDLPIYRQAEGRFYEDLRLYTEARLKRAIDSHGIARERVPDSVLGIEERSREACHAPWRFNQVVGWVRVYALGFSIRGELWWTTEKYVRRRPVKRRIENIGKAFELSVFPSESDEDIVKRLRHILPSSTKGLRRRGLVLDTDTFERLSSYLPWRRILSDAAALWAT